jgi:hypothetical protein
MKTGVFAMNEKGGMHEVKLEKYIITAIVSLYPDLRDIIVKADSGPGVSI